jgi:hypothetical protein
MSEFARPPQAGPIEVEGVAVFPPVTAGQAELLAGAGLLADRPDTLLAAWTSLADAWAATVERARALDPEALGRRVGGEWSFVETQRHLVFLVDSWIGGIVQGRFQPHHPLGLPPHFIDGRALGLDLDATPSLDEVLALRAERTASVSDLIAGSTPGDLERPVTNGFAVLGALQVVMFEHWAHHRYATRDLAVLESGGQTERDSGDGNRGAR